MRNHCALFLLLICLAAAPATRPLDLDRASARQLVAAIVEARDEGGSPSRYVQPAADRGMAAAVACAQANANQNKPVDTLYEVMALAGKSRRSDPELLRLYDPVAFRIFYSPTAKDEQTTLARRIDEHEWPPHFAEAMVHAAPLPTLDWMTRQAAAPTPDAADLRRVWQHWGWWIRTGNERQYTPDVRRIVARLAANPAVVHDAPTHAALVKFIGEAGAVNSLDVVIAATRVSDEPDKSVREEAATALGRLAASHEMKADARSRALAALVEAGAKEPAAGVLAKLAESAEQFPDGDAAGQAMLDLFRRVPDPAVRRSILFSAAEAKWPQRTTLLLEALERIDEDGSVRGVALQAIAAHPSKEFVEPTLAILNAVKTPQPQVIDAAGATGDPRAAPRLIAWLKAEPNPSARLKIALALERINDTPSRAALLDLLGREDNAVVMDHLVTIAGRIHLDEAAPALIALAEDKTAPPAVRASAVWSLGHFDRPAVREALARWWAHPEQYFGDPNDIGLPAGLYDRIEQARIYVLMSRLRLGDEDAAKEMPAMFDRSTPTAQLAMLMMLADQRRDESEIIDRGLRSSDFAVLLAAVKAAGAADAMKYHARLLTIRETPFVASMLRSEALDTNTFRTALAGAIAAGEPAATTKTKESP